MKSCVGVREMRVSERDQRNAICVCLGDKKRDKDREKERKDRARERHRERAGVQPLNPADPLAPSVSGLDDSS